MNYDRDILIKNIRQLMKDNDVTQSDLAQISDTYQNRVSNLLNGSGDFTISQLVSIAVYFKVSLDDLLGLTSENKKESNYETYSDIFKIFFSLADSLDITIKNVNRRSVEGPNLDEFLGNYDPRFDDIVQRAISFSDDVIVNVLGEWRTALEEITQLTGGEELYETWKQGILSKYNFKIGSQKTNSLSEVNGELSPNIKKCDSFLDISDEELPFA